MNIAAMLLAAVVVAAPVLPGNADQIFSRGVMCPGQGGVWLKGYDTDGSKDSAEIVQFGRIGLLEPMAWLFYKDDSSEVLYTVLTLPGLEPRKMSLEALEAEIGGGPCELPAVKEAP